MPTKQPSKQEISLYHDLVALRDRGWSDEQLADYAGVTVAEVKKILAKPPKENE